MSISYNSCTYSSAFVVVCTYIIYMRVCLCLCLCLCLYLCLCVCVSVRLLYLSISVCVCVGPFFEFSCRKMRVWRLLLQKCRAYGENTTLFCGNVRVICGNVEYICRNVKRTCLVARLVGNRHCATAFFVSTSASGAWVTVCVAVCCSVFQCVTVRCGVRNGIFFVRPVNTLSRHLQREWCCAHNNALQHTVTHCNTLQHTQTECRCAVPISD